MTQDSVAKATDVTKGGMALIRKLVQSQHRTIATICEWGLQQLEYLRKHNNGEKKTFLIEF